MQNLCPTAHHWGGSIGVHNIVRTDKATGEKTIVERNLHSHQVNVERRVTTLWNEYSKARGFDSFASDLSVFYDDEVVGYYPVDPEKAKNSPKWSRICPVCGK